METLTGDRVIEAEGGCVQEQAIGGNRAAAPAQKIADVDRLAHKWIASFGEVNPDLMGASGFQAHPAQRGAAQVFNHFDIGDGPLALAKAFETATQTVAAIFDQLRFDSPRLHLPWATAAYSRSARCSLKILCSPRSASLVLAKQTKPEVSLSMR